jgi:hypothetical protein
MPLRLSAAAALTAGVLLIAAVPLTELVSGEFFLLAPLALLLLLAAVPGLRSTIPDGGGQIGRLAVRALLGGALVAGLLLLLEGPLTAAGAPDALGWVAALAAGICALGWFALAGAALRSGGEPRWAWTVLLVAPVVGTPAEAFAQIQVLDLIGVTCVAAVGAALVGLGLELRRSPAPPVLEAAPAG